MSASSLWRVAVALLVASNAQAQEALLPDSIDINPPASWEGGWAIVSNESGNGFSKIEFRPAKQTADSNRNAVMLFEIWGGSQRDGAARLLGAWETDLRKTCPQVSSNQGATKSANGFSVHYVQFLCPKRSDTGEGSLHFVKTISSDKHTFLVGVLRGSPPFTLTGMTVSYADTAEVEGLTRWIKSTNAYLENVHACDGHSPFVKVCSP